MDKEPIQIVDDNDEPLRGATRQEALKNGWRHRIVSILVWNQAGEMLVQRRTDDADECPGCWGVSAAGYVLEHERYDVAVSRKLADELGLSNLQLKDIGTFNFDADEGNKSIRRVHKVFEAEVQSDIELRLDPKKVQDVQWLSAAEIKQLVTNGTDKVTSGLTEVAKRFM